MALFTEKQAQKSPVKQKKISEKTNEDMYGNITINFLY